MKVIIVAALILSADVFAAAEYSKHHSRDNQNTVKTDAPTAKNAGNGDLVKGQSSDDRRTYAPGANKGAIKDSSIQGANCVTETGVNIAPNGKGYKNCVDNANRIKQ